MACEKARVLQISTEKGELEQHLAVRKRWRVRIIESITTLREGRGNPILVSKIYKIFFCQKKRRSFLIFTMLPKCFLKFSENSYKFKIPAVTGT